MNTTPTVESPIRYGFRMSRRGKVLCEEFGFAIPTGCTWAARANPHFTKATCVTILRDSGGTDHPDNAGKYFLHQILK